ncbi:hypothetical protein HD599_000015 [Conyzicola lurida]|uniref:Uncharacterized protein n=1 Tax=Conyzicola lurida TaxID=1172621 RepID=A0A841AI71_9MICO|nr:hypothetical protein [Conyzicola lurida]MBB5841692.1 hypothetical protein [Conyzicola lurida]
MTDPADHNPDALVKGNRVTNARDMESSDEPGYEGEAPNAPLASQGSRDGTPVGEDQDDE